MAIDEPMTPRRESGVLKAMTDAMMMTTRLIVLPTCKLQKNGQPAEVASYKMNMNTH